MVITVSAISGVVDSLPKKLQQLEQQPFTVSGIDHQSIGRLKHEVELIRGAFEQYSSLENPTEFTRQWMQKVREVAFDIEESIDRYINGVGDDAGNVAASGGIAGTLSRLARFLDGMMKRRPALRRSISDELKLQQERLHVQFREKPTIMASTTAHPDLYSPRTTATTTDLQLASRPLLVGMDDARKEVTAMVLDGDSAAGIKVISIVGMAGAGKTTLAKEVYCEIGEHFQHRAFVSVGRRPDALFKVLLGLLSHVADGNDSVLYQDAINMDDELKIMKAIIRDRLQHKRYLIVIDDLWSTEAWQEVWPCFPKNNPGSRVVTTTRIEAVAKACCSSDSDYIFRIPLLNESDSATLFYRVTSGSKNDCPPDLKDASMHILRKCNGLPLAIVNIAAAYKTSPASALKDFELDSQPNKSSYLHGMKETFEQSYNDIPPQLKSCLLYLSIFPERYEIRRQRLIRRWIAEGFIEEEHGVDKEETAKKYFEELINRNLIQPVQVDYDGNARSCRVHPVMLDFIVCKSMEENFVTLVHPGDDHTTSSNSAIRWLTVQCKANNEEDQGHGTAAQTKESVGLSHTRSLSVFGEVGAMPQLKKMEMLRVLDLEDCQGSLDPSIDVLPMLFLLRYLSLRGTDVSRLPPKIGSLRHLETIDIRSTRIQELPPSIVDLHNLVNLLAGMISLPRGVGKLRALRTLSFADILRSTSSAVQELAHLTNLMELAIFCSQEYKANLLPVLQKLAGHGLRSLIVAGSSGCWMESSHSLPTRPRYSFQRFKIDGKIVLNDATPKSVASSWANLVEMDINFQQLSAEGLSVLESIDSLLRLCLCIVSVEQEQLTFRRFPSLKELCFRCRNLPSLSFSAHALPMLQQLELNFQECSSSSSQEPTVSGLGYLLSLTHVVIAFPREDVGTKVVADVRKAALVHSKHPNVDLKIGKEFSSVGDTEFEDLRLSSYTFMVPQREKKRNTYSIHENLLRIQIMIIISWFPNVQKSNAGQSDLVIGLLPLVLVTVILECFRVLRSDESNQFKGMGIYVDTGVSVIIAYVLLIVINFQYFILVPFPICLLGFIAYLWKKILVKGKLQQQFKRSDDTEKYEGLEATEQCPSPSKGKLQQQFNRSDDTEKYEGLEATEQCPKQQNRTVAQDRKKIEEILSTAAVPYFVLLISAQYGDGSPALSHFLVFSCCVLGMLALMYYRLADDVSPGLTRALRWIQMAYMVMMFITVHTMAAEWLGEIVALVCIPELIAGLVWFSTFLHGGNSYRAADKVATYNDGFLFIPLGAVLASLTSTYGYEEDFLGSWYTEAMVFCVVAGCMLYLSLWMISRWPGSVPGSDKATQLLKFPANICLTGACLMLFALLSQKALDHGLFGLEDHINPGSLKYLPGIYFTTSVAWLVAWYLKPRAAR